MNETTQGGYARPPRAAKYLGIGESTLWNLLKKDSTFPRPIKASPRTTLFSIPELEAWMQAKKLGRTEWEQAKRVVKRRPTSSQQ